MFPPLSDGNPCPVLAIRIICSRIGCDVWRDQLWRLQPQEGAPVERVEYQAWFNGRHSNITKNE